jgi:hypothetical protein
MVDQKKMVGGSVIELFLTKIITISIGFPMEKNLVRVEKCPWCNGKFRVPNDIFADTTNHYITTILGTTP